ncbi:MAG: hypothetical protein GY862_25545 [Gammaproteobacteria bacterium]|nr:hypothetical protein [Gammaproteobacteria bacterium]
MREIEGVEGLVYNVNDGTFDLMYQGRAHHLSPNFDSKATDLVKGARVASQITINQHGDSLEYLHQSGTQAITTTVHISPRMHGIIHEPGIFASTVSAFPGIDAVTPNTDGSFDVSMPGQTFVITATFHVLTAEFNPQTDTPVIPAVSINSEGSITYEVQTDIRVVNTRLLVEAKLPEVPSPTLLIAKLSEAGAVRIVLNSDGSFSGMISGQGFTLTPTSDVQTQTLTAGEQIPPSIASNEDGSLSYTAQQGNQVVTVKLLVMFD